MSPDRFTLVIISLCVKNDFIILRLRVQESLINYMHEKSEIKCSSGNNNISNIMVLEALSQSFLNGLLSYIYIPYKLYTI